VDIRAGALLAKGVYRDYQWVVVANDIGFRCGYVCLPLGHPWHGKDYDEVEADVHGGLTYAKAEASGAGDGWWLGFDCAHAGDAPDPELYSWRIGAPGYGGVIRTTGYVVDECIRLIRQADDLLGYRLVVVPEQMEG
jgi:hypothetical protein